LYGLSGAIMAALESTTAASAAFRFRSGGVARALLSLVTLHSDLPRGVLLDIDGTLLDSNEQHARAWADALAERDMLVPHAILRRLIGKGGDKILSQVARIDDDSAEGHEITARRQVIFRRHYLATCTPLPGARALLSRMIADGLTLAVATSSNEEDLGALLRAAGIHDLIRTAATSDDVERSKPDPDIVVHAARKTGLAPRLLVMLGDAPYDVEAAARSGIRAVALRCGGWDDGALGGAVAIYDDPRDLLRRYEQSPFGAARLDASARTLRRARG
jgi:HAD superfamily hydrolase (TIGR01509 family)